MKILKGNIYIRYTVDNKTLKEVKKRNKKKIENVFFKGEKW